MASDFDPTLILNVTEAKVPVDTILTVRGDDLAKATLSEVKVTGVRVGPRGKVEKKKVTLSGALKADMWTAKSFLEPGTEYKVTGTLDDGVTIKNSFKTQVIPLNKQTYPSFYPGGGTFGIAQPIALRFDVPITDRAALEKTLEIKTTPKQVGSWRWFNNNEVRYRPKKYWKPGTKITVKARMNSVPLGKNVYGQFNKKASFKISSTARSAKVDLNRQVVTAYKNGKAIRTIPVSTGKAGFRTRSGTKVIMGHSRHFTMNSGSIGLDPNASDGYNLTVEYAMRVTNSGEFFHAAPWNSGSFGRAGASHGCIGSSTANAAWLYGFLKEGDPVKFTGSSRGTAVDNGFGDWNISFSKYKKGSAL